MKISNNRIRQFVMSAFILAVPAITLSTTDALAQHQVRQYAAKFLCGKSEGVGAIQGVYETGVNVHNPTYEHIPVRYKIAVALPGGQEGPISSFENIRIGPDGAVEFVCKDVFAALEDLVGGLPPLVTGFLVLESPSNLDVASVVSSSDFNGASVALEIYEVRERTFNNEMPDLIVQSLCLWSRDVAEATIKNVGDAAAPPSTTRILMTPVKDDFVTPNGPTVVVDLPTSGLSASGGEEKVEADISASCYNPNCQVRAVADIFNSVFESDEMNNESGVSVCIG